MRINGIVVSSGKAGFGASELFESLIVDEESKSALRGVALGRTNTQIHGGGFAGAIGGFERVEIEL